MIKVKFIEKMRSVHTHTLSKAPKMEKKKQYKKLIKQTRKDEIAKYILSD